MPKHFIEKPKKPACLQIQNIVLIIATIFILLFFDYLFLAIFIVAMGIFCIYDVLEYKKMPEAILYARDHNLFYYHKKVLNRMPYQDITNVSVTTDKKKNTYIQIDYKHNNYDRQILIKNKDAENIVFEINKTVKKGLKDK